MLAREFELLHNFAENFTQFFFKWQALQIIGSCSYLKILRVAAFF